jgi:hypothetical protein
MVIYSQAQHCCTQEGGAWECAPDGKSRPQPSIEAAGARRHLAVER